MNDYELLRQALERRAPEGVALAFSGGVDSSLLLAMLCRIRRDTPFPLTALIMHSVFQSPEELTQAENAARAEGVDMQVFHTDPLSIPGVEDNPPNRCYLCKRHIFQEFRAFASGHHFTVLMDGTNADDLQTYRPGLAALAELNVISPLAELGFTKKQVRTLAAQMNLSCAARPSVPCMATRFPYGAKLSGERITQVMEAEKRVRALLPPRADLRVRVHEDLARIEVSAEWIDSLAAQHEKISGFMRSLGFRYVTLDLTGFRSGSMDSVPENTPR